MRTLLLACGLLVGLIFACDTNVPTAGADTGPVVSCDRHTGVCTVIASQPKSDGTSEGSTPACRWEGETVPCSTGQGSFNSRTGCYDQQVAPGSVDAGPVLAEYKASGGSIVFETCPFGGSGGYVWVAPAKAVVTAAAVRERVVRLIPSAAVGLAPKTATLVNIETVVWVAAPARRTLPMVPILGQHVVISLKVDHVVYDFGDGTGDPHGPVGKAYDAVHDPCRTRDCADYYGHVYTLTGTKTVTATVFWQASFTVDGGQVQQVPGTVPGPDASATVRVREARAVLVPNP